MQTASHLPESVPLCGNGHKPQFVTTQGAPTGHQLGSPCPPLFHIECHACGLATIPTPNRALVELRWTREDTAALRIPISHLQRYRAAVLGELATMPLGACPVVKQRYVRPAFSKRFYECYCAAVEKDDCRCMPDLSSPVMRLAALANSNTGAR